MITRRSFVRQSLVTSTSLLLTSMTGISFSQVASAAEGRRWQMPDEGAPHAATWMAFGASAAIWEPHLLPVVRKNLALVANTIAAFEPVNMLVREEDHALAAKLCEPSVNLLVHPIDDLWIRDTGPVFVKAPTACPAALDLTSTAGARSRNTIAMPKWLSLSRIMLKLNLSAQH